MRGSVWKPCHMYVECPSVDEGFRLLLVFPGLLESIILMTVQWALLSSCFVKWSLSLDRCFLSAMTPCKFPASFFISFCNVGLSDKCASIDLLWGARRRGTGSLFLSLLYMRCISSLEQYNKGVESIFVGFACWIPTQRAIDCSGGDKPLRSNPVPLIDCQVCALPGFILWSVVKTHLPLPTLKWARTFLSCWTNCSYLIVFCGLKHV